MLDNGVSYHCKSKIQGKEHSLVSVKPFNQLSLDDILLYFIEKKPAEKCFSLVLLQSSFITCVVFLKFILSVQIQR